MTCYHPESWCGGYHFVFQQEANGLMRTCVEFKQTVSRLWYYDEHHAVLMDHIISK